MDGSTTLLRPATLESPARRRWVVGAAALACAPLAGAATLQGIEALGGGTLPTYVPDASSDAAVHTVAESLFWNEQMKEHATFFTMLMPGDALAEPRAQAKAFESRFADLVKKAHGTVPAGVAALSQASIEASREFVGFKREMQERQTSGRLQSLVWPTFFEHTAREGEYFISRLTALSRGQTDVDREEATHFWLLIMGEHAGFVGHLLDPREKALVERALKSQDKLLGLAKDRSRSGHRAMDAVDDILDFKVAAQKGIETGSIKSIIAPALADHVRREALKAGNELRRAV
jgi:hypothetical protein